MEMQIDHPVNTAELGGPTWVRMTVFEACWLEGGMEGWQGQSEPLQGQSQGLGGILPVDMSRGAGGERGREQGCEVGFSSLSFIRQEAGEKEGQGSWWEGTSLRLGQEGPQEVCAQR